MILKAFYDSGNKLDSSSYDLFTLTSIFGTKDEWTLFARGWEAALRKNKNVPYLHTKDAMATPPRDVYAGWSGAEIERLLSDCISVIDAHRAIPIGKRNPGRMGLGIFTQTIVLKDYDKAKQNKSDLPALSEICATNAVARTFEWREAINIVETRADFIHMIFDRGDPFYGHVRDRLDNKQVGKILPEFKRVSKLIQADMRDNVALQMADVICWSCNHPLTRTHRWKNRLLSFKWIRDDFDYARFLNPSQEAIDLVESWRLPKRKATK